MLQVVLHGVTKVLHLVGGGDAEEGQHGMIYGWWCSVLQRKDIEATSADDILLPYAAEMLASMVAVLLSVDIGAARSKRRCC
jgi:hypothetical protein